MLRIVYFLFPHCFNPLHNYVWTPTKRLLGRKSCQPKVLQTTLISWVPKKAVVSLKTLKSPPSQHQFWFTFFTAIYITIPTQCTEPLISLVFRGHRSLSYYCGLSWDYPKTKRGYEYSYSVISYFFSGVRTCLVIATIHDTRAMLKL